MSNKGKTKSQCSFAGCEKMPTFRCDFTDEKSKQCENVFCGEVSDVALASDIGTDAHHGFFKIVKSEKPYETEKYFYYCKKHAVRFFTKKKITAQKTNTESTSRSTARMSSKNVSRRNIASQPTRNKSETNPDDKSAVRVYQLRRMLNDLKYLAKVFGNVVKFDTPRVKFSDLNETSQTMFNRAAKTCDVAYYDRYMVEKLCQPAFFWFLENKSISDNVKSDFLEKNATEFEIPENDFDTYLEAAEAHDKSIQTLDRKVLFNYDTSGPKWKKSLGFEETQADLQTHSLNSGKPYAVYFGSKSDTPSDDALIIEFVCATFSQLSKSGTPSAYQTIEDLLDNLNSFSFSEDVYQVLLESTNEVSDIDFNFLGSNNIDLAKKWLANFETLNENYKIINEFPDMDVESRGESDVITRLRDRYLALCETRKCRLSINSSKFSTLQFKLDQNTAKDASDYWLTVFKNVFGAMLWNFFYSSILHVMTNNEQNFWPMLKDAFYVSETHKKNAEGVRKYIERLNVSRPTKDEYDAAIGKIKQQKNSINRFLPDLIVDLKDSLLSRVAQSFGLIGYDESSTMKESLIPSDGVDGPTVDARLHLSCVFFGGPDFKSKTKLSNHVKTAKEAEFDNLLIFGLKNMLLRRIQLQDDSKISENHEYADILFKTKKNLNDVIFEHISNIISPNKLTGRGILTFVFDTSISVLKDEENTIEKERIGKYFKKYTENHAFEHNNEIYDAEKILNAIRTIGRKTTFFGGLQFTSDITVEDAFLTDICVYWINMCLDFIFSNVENVLDRYRDTPIQKFINTHSDVKPTIEQKDFEHKAQPGPKKRKRDTKRKSATLEEPQEKKQKITQTNKQSEKNEQKMEILNEKRESIISAFAERGTAFFKKIGCTVSSEIDVKNVDKGSLLVDIKTFISKFVADRLAFLDNLPEESKLEEISKQNYADSIRANKESKNHPIIITHVDGVEIVDLSNLTKIDIGAPLLQLRCYESDTNDVISISGCFLFFKSLFDPTLQTSTFRYERKTSKHTNVEAPERELKWTAELNDIDSEFRYKDILLPKQSGNLNGSKYFAALITYMHRWLRAFKQTVEKIFSEQGYEKISTIFSKMVVRSIAISSCAAAPYGFEVSSMGNDIVILSSKFKNFVHCVEHLDDVENINDRQLTDFIDIMVFNLMNANENVPITGNSKARSAGVLYGTKGFTLFNANASKSPTTVDTDPNGDYATLKKSFDVYSDKSFAEDQPNTQIEYKPMVSLANMIHVVGRVTKYDPRSKFTFLPVKFEYTKSLNKQKQKAKKQSKKSKKSTEKKQAKYLVPRKLESKLESTAAYDMETQCATMYHYAGATYMSLLTQFCCACLGPKNSKTIGCVGISKIPESMGQSQKQEKPSYLGVPIKYRKFYAALLSGSQCVANEKTREKSIDENFLKDDIEFEHGFDKSIILSLPDSISVKQSNEEKTAAQKTEKKKTAAQKTEEKKTVAQKISPTTKKTKRHSGEEHESKETQPRRDKRQKMDHKPTFPESSASSESSTPEPLEQEQNESWPEQTDDDAMSNKKEEGVETESEEENEEDSHDENMFDLSSVGDNPVTFHLASTKLLVDDDVSDDAHDSSDDAEYGDRTLFDFAEDAECESAVAVEPFGDRFFEKSRHSDMARAMIVDPDGLDVATTTLGRASFEDDARATDEALKIWITGFVGLSLKRESKKTHTLSDLGFAPILNDALLAFVRSNKSEDDEPLSKKLIFASNRTSETLMVVNDRVSKCRALYKNASRAESVLAKDADANAIAVRSKLRKKIQKYLQDYDAVIVQKRVLTLAKSLIDEALRGEKDASLIKTLKMRVVNLYKWYAYHACCWSFVRNAQTLDYLVKKILSGEIEGTKTLSKLVAFYSRCVSVLKLQKETFDEKLKIDYDRLFYYSGFSTVVFKLKWLVSQMTSTKRPSQTDDRRERCAARLREAFDAFKSLFGDRALTLSIVNEKNNERVLELYRLLKEQRSAPKSEFKKSWYSAFRKTMCRSYQCCESALSYKRSVDHVVPKMVGRWSESYDRRSALQSLKTDMYNAADAVAFENELVWLTYGYESHSSDGVKLVGKESKRLHSLFKSSCYKMKSANQVLTLPKSFEALRGVQKYVDRALNSGKTYEAETLIADEEIKNLVVVCASVLERLVRYKMVRVPTFLTNVARSVKNLNAETYELYGVSAPRSFSLSAIKWLCHYRNNVDNVEKQRKDVGKMVAIVGHRHLIKFKRASLIPTDPEMIKKSKKHEMLSKAYAAISNINEPSASAWYIVDKMRKEYAASLESKMKNASTDRASYWYDYEGYLLSSRKRDKNVDAYERSREEKILEILAKLQASNEPPKFEEILPNADEDALTKNPGIALGLLNEKALPKRQETIDKITQLCAFAIDSFERLSEFAKGAIAIIGSQTLKSNEGYAFHVTRIWKKLVRTAEKRINSYECKKRDLYSIGVNADSERTLNAMLIKFQQRLNDFGRDVRSKHDNVLTKNPNDEIVRKALLEIMEQIDNEIEIRTKISNDRFFAKYSKPMPTSSSFETIPFEGRTVGGRSFGGGRSHYASPRHSYRHSYRPTIAASRHHRGRVAANNDVWRARSWRSTRAYPSRVNRPSIRGRSGGIFGNIFRPNYYRPRFGWGSRFYLGLALSYPWIAPLPVYYDVGYNNRGLGSDYIYETKALLSERRTLVDALSDCYALIETESSQCAIAQDAECRLRLQNLRKSATNLKESIRILDAAISERDSSYVAGPYFGAHTSSGCGAERGFEVPQRANDPSQIKPALSLEKMEEIDRSVGLGESNEATAYELLPQTLLRTVERVIQSSYHDNSTFAYGAEVAYYDPIMRCGLKWLRPTLEYLNDNERGLYDLSERFVALKQLDAFNHSKSATSLVDDELSALSELLSKQRVECDLYNTHIVETASSLLLTKKKTNRRNASFSSDALTKEKYDAVAKEVFSNLSSTVDDVLKTEWDSETACKTGYIVHDKAKSFFDKLFSTLNAESSASAAWDESSEKQFDRAIKNMIWFFALHKHVEFAKIAEYKNQASKLLEAQARKGKEWKNRNVLICKTMIALRVLVAVSDVYTYDAISKLLSTLKFKSVDPKVAHMLMIYAIYGCRPVALSETQTHFSTVLNALSKANMFERDPKQCRVICKYALGDEEYAYLPRISYDMTDNVEKSTVNRWRSRLCETTNGQSDVSRETFLDDLRNEPRTAIDYIDWISGECKLYDGTFSAQLAECAVLVQKLESVDKWFEIYESSGRYAALKAVDRAIVRKLGSDDPTLVALSSVFNTVDSGESSSTVSSRLSNIRVDPSELDEHLYCASKMLSKLNGALGSDSKSNVAALDGLISECSKETDEESRNISFLSGKLAVDMGEFISGKIAEYDAAISKTPSEPDDEERSNAYPKTPDQKTAFYVVSRMVEDLSSGKDVERSDVYLDAYLAGYPKLNFEETQKDIVDFAACMLACESSCRFSNVFEICESLCDKMYKWKTLEETLTSHQKTISLWSDHLEKLKKFDVTAVATAPREAPIADTKSDVASYEASTKTTKTTTTTEIKKKGPLGLLGSKKQTVTKNETTSTSSNKGKPYDRKFNPNDVNKYAKPLAKGTSKYASEKTRVLGEKIRRKEDRLSRRKIEKSNDLVSVFNDTQSSKDDKKITLKQGRIDALKTKRDAKMSGTKEPKSDKNARRTNKEALRTNKKETVMEKQSVPKGFDASNVARKNNTYKQRKLVEGSQKNGQKSRDSASFGQKYNNRASKQDSKLNKQRGRKSKKSTSAKGSSKSKK